MYLVKRIQYKKFKSLKIIKIINDTSKNRIYHSYNSIKIFYIGF